MPEATAVLVDTLFKVLTGFIAGFVARDLSQRRGIVGGKPKARSAAAGKPVKLVVPRPAEELKMVRSFAMEIALPAGEW
jgi:hypothetical protein